MTVVKVIIQLLSELGVEYTFGIPGAQNLGLFDALLDSRIKNVLPTSELSVIFMADGYSRATGKTGVCLVIPGPGITNILTGLAEAYADSSAIVVLVPGFGSRNRGFHMHEIQQLEVARSVVKEVIQINNVKEIRKSIERAFFLAQEGEPGPVIVEIAKEVLEGRISNNENDDIKYEENDVIAVETKIDDIIDVLVTAKACGIYAGQGAFSAANELRQLAEMFSMPVATTISGKGVFPEDHDLSVGFGFGPVGSMLAENIFSACDVILALGCKFNEMATGGWSMKMPTSLIHIDKNMDIFDRNYQTRISLCMDIKTALGKILLLLKEFKREKNSVLIKKIISQRHAHIDRASRQTASMGVHPTQLFYQLRRLMSRDAVLVADCGAHQLWAIADFEVYEPRTFIAPSDYQAMGFAIPSAIGVKVGIPDSEVVCICGDGGFLMSGFEILTAVREKIKLIIIVFNDGALGLIKNLQKKQYGRTNSVDLIAPRYGDLASAFGIEYIEISSESDIADGIKEAQRREKTVLINIKIFYNETPKYITGLERVFLKNTSWQEKAAAVIRITRSRLTV